MMLPKKNPRSGFFRFLIGFVSQPIFGIGAILLILLLMVWRGLNPLPGTNSIYLATSTLSIVVDYTPLSTPERTEPPAATQTPEPSPDITPSPTNWFGVPFTIGYSVEGRPLEVYQFGNGPKERLIVAGIHGGYEWNTVVLAEELISYIMEDPNVIPPEVTLYILKNMNPDGYAKAWDATGRANANGVDLNRNFDAEWLVDWNRDVCFNRVYVTAGPEPGSEPETQAIMSFITSHEIEAMIIYHSAGLGIFPGGSPPGPKSQMLAYYISGITPYAYPPKDIGCVYSGAMANWAALQGVPSVDIELSTHGDTDLSINIRVLEFFVKTELNLEQ